MTRAVLEISKELYEFAQQQAGLFGYTDTEDYLSGMLNALLVSAKAEFEEKRPQRRSADPADAELDFFNELEEDEGGAMRHKDEDEVLPETPDDGGDLDDGSLLWKGCV